ncbi:arsenite efflux transporter metallochaperone ArsD [Sedimentibacter sp.]|uniref:arsenite efflux transporter metallochaperone ArsD n=1 Tax=Sedimentibacter sp. TaxID=1960295 RepID=UPI0028A723F0|nr:arsenite efflux transporter metallochaperone ArsD [Sedimentibacter sp.]
MKRIQIFEPAMCCSTGVCGVGVDTELIRISTVINMLNNKGIEVERFNLSNAPQEFIKNNKINKLINEKGVDVLPAILLDGELVVTGRYPTNEEIAKFFDLTVRDFGSRPNVLKASRKKSGGCGCDSGGDC